MQGTDSCSITTQVNAVYGLSADADLRFLVGRELIQICIGRHQAAMHFFPEGVSILIETEITCRTPDGQAKRFETIPESAPMLVSLLNAVVTHVSVRPPGTLRLEFDSDHTVEIEDTSTSYESYQIRNGDQLIVV